MTVCVFPYDFCSVDFIINWQANLILSYSSWGLIYAMILKELKTD